VALYFESSISQPDWKLLPRIAAGARVVERHADGGLLAESDKPFGVVWSGPALVDGELWPLSDRETVWLPRGRFRIEAAVLPPPGRVLWLNAEPLTAGVEDRDVVVRYRSTAAAPVLLDRGPSQTLLDGEPWEAGWEQIRTHWAGRLPAGEHEVRVRF
jgi:hypothetical protein